MEDKKPTKAYDLPATDTNSYKNEVYDKVLVSSFCATAKARLNKIIHVLKTGKLNSLSCFVLRLTCVQDHLLDIKNSLKLKSAHLSVYKTHPPF